MNKFFFVTLTLLCSLVYQAYTLRAQVTIRQENPYPKVSFEKTELRTITSTNVPEQEFLIKIGLPESYARSDTIRYPVIYLTDADLVFGIATDMADLLRIGHFMPKVIIVGIAYGAKLGQKGNMRDRDFSPFPDENGIIGASRFLKFITDELFPFIEKEYKVDKTDKTLYGVSSGGWFALYVLFSSPELFQRYIIASPDLASKNKWAFRHEEEFYNKRQDLPVQVYMSTGEIEWLYPLFPEFIEIVEERNYEGFRFKWEILKNGRHFSVIAEAISRGLKYIYNGESISALMLNYIKEKDVKFAIDQYHQIKQKSSNEYNFSERELNLLGYLLLGMNRADDAVEILKLNVESYPNSANTYDRLGNGYLANDEREKAIMSYRQALKIDPNFSASLNNLKKLGIEK